MDTQVLCVLADVSGSICNGDSLMLATLSRVCKVFNERIGSCNKLLENLVATDYFVDRNIEEIYRNYGYPSRWLCKVYCFSFMNDFDPFLDSSLFVKFERVHAELTDIHRRCSVVSNFINWMQVKKIYKLLRDTYGCMILKKFGYGTVLITHFVEKRHKQYLEDM